MNKFIPVYVIVLFMSKTVKAKKKPLLSFELEGGVLWQSRNEIQVPNEEAASRISLLDPLGKGPLPVGRFYASWNINPNHAIRLLFAPLQVSQSKSMDDTIVFDNKTFGVGTEIDFTYKFNSYRLGYSYRLLNLEKLKGRIGFTAKIRDARVTLENNNNKGEITDLGFVPLLYLYLDYNFYGDFYLLFDFNGLAGGPGRAFDVALKLKYDLNQDFSFTAGYRTIEGGVDVSSVYNFAWLHYAVISVIYNY
ncbi:MAG: hypothetical protein PF689_05825 [Deltaproteobacteria bacterium]|jgi:hypothetical protein|nr:hypothetical protein [Deltaproteobacteria bacterium]